jgi:hypothetical protein
MADGQVERIPFDDPRLGRHIRHDPRSRNFALPRHADLSQPVKWRNWGQKLDQGDLGACTGYAAAHCLNHMPMRASIRPRPTLKNAQAEEFYSIATGLDPWPGQWRPDDTGSSGLAACQAAVHLGFATGYRWAFGFDHGRAALRDGPLMMGSYWDWNMFEPDKDGYIRTGGGVAGGHEFIITADYPDLGEVWGLNSWGPSWGGWGPVQRNGYRTHPGMFRMKYPVFRELLERDGDLVRPVA